MLTHEPILEIDEKFYQARFIQSAASIAAIKNFWLFLPSKNGKDCIKCFLENKSL